MIKNYCTTREAAQLLGVSVRTVQLWSENGMLTAWKTQGGHRRITRESVEALLSRPDLPSEPTPPETDGRFRILLVEDEPIQLMMYEAMLSQWPMNPLLDTAVNGFEALIRLGRDKYHLLITDLELPGIDGFQMLSTIHRHPELKDLAIVAVTGLSAEEINARGPLPDNIPVLFKPIPFNVLEKFASELWQRRVQLEKPGLLGSRAPH